MKKILIILPLTVLLACKKQGVVHYSKSYSVKDKFLKIDNYNDTFKLGDTIGVHFIIPKTLKTLDSETINIEKVNYINAGFNFRKYKFDGSYLDFVPKIVEQNKESLSDPAGQISFRQYQISEFDNLIHFVPQDTGYFCISTHGYSQFAAKVQGVEGISSISANIDFFDTIKSDYLMDYCEYTRSSLTDEDSTANRKFFFFYVKPRK